jgi:hypothetical protein
VEMLLGEEKNFSVQVSDPDKDDRLVYLWSLDGEERARSEKKSWDVPASLSDGSHRVTVDVVDKAGESVRLAWNVAVKAPAPSPPPPTVQPPEEKKPTPPAVAAVPPSRPPTPPTSKRQMSRTDAEEWLEETYRRSWEAKNVDMLVKLGEVTSQDADKLRSILDGYKNFRVALQNVDIRPDGNRATIRFIRVDTIDGKALPHPPKEIVLERLSDGRISRRK